VGGKCPFCNNDTGIDPFSDAAKAAAVKAAAEVAELVRDKKLRDLLCQVVEERKLLASLSGSEARRLAKAAKEDPRLVSKAEEATAVAKVAAKAVKDAAWKAMSARRVACFKATHKGQPLPW